MQRDKQQCIVTFLEVGGTEKAGLVELVLEVSLLRPRQDSSERKPALRPVIELISSNSGNDYWNLDKVPK